MDAATVPTTLEDLRAQWETLHDLDKAASVRRMLKPGMSLRFLAEELGCCSEALLRNLLKAESAPVQDRMLARNGEISTRELVRRAKLAQKKIAEKAKATEEERRSQESHKWSNSICRWLQEQDLAWTHQENVLEETMRELMLAERTGGLPKLVAPDGMPLKEVIARTRPKDPHWEQAIELYFFVQWLGLWTIAAIPDRNVQYDAIALALSRTRRRETVSVQ